MQDNHLFEYAVIRIVPRVEREEFINAGIVLFCKKKKFLRCMYEVNEQKIKMLFADADINLIRENLESFCRIAAGAESRSPIAKLEAPERFRWLTATRSTVLQLSKVHPGLCENEMEELEKLFKQYVQ